MVTDEPPSLQTLWRYALRFQVEELFLDSKSGAFEVGTFAPKLVRVLLSEFLTPFPNRFIRHLDPAIQHHFLNVPVAQRKQYTQTQ